MDLLKLSDIMAACNGAATEDTEITDVCIDTRKVTKGCLFICIKGERFDGHDFIDEAQKNGAAAVMVHRDVNANIPIVKVSDTSKALLELGGWYRSRFNIPVVGLTGSVGKTTTKELIYLVLCSKYKAIKTLGNLNNEIGLPQMLLSMGKDTEAAVIEMGMNHFEEISRLSKATKPNVGLITNIGVSHIENLGSRENILKAKLEILDGMKSDSPLIINSDDDMLKTVKNSGHKIYTFGVESGDFRATCISEENEKTVFTVSYFGKEQQIEIPTIGIHNVYNALAAFAVGYCLDIEPFSAAKALSSYVPEGMRQRVVEINGIMSIEDCYNASPDSMKAALTTLKNMKANKRTAVLSDMLELGDYSTEAHKSVGELIGVLGIDSVYAFGKYSKFYIESAQKFGCENAQYFKSKDELMSALAKDVSQGEAVLFKASRGMKLEEVIHFVYDRWEKI